VYPEVRKFEEERVENDGVLEETGRVLDADKRKGCVEDGMWVVVLFLCILELGLSRC
jgi:hypothetical protein